MNRSSGQRSHIVADAISRVLAEHDIYDGVVTEDIMSQLEAIRLVSYQRRDRLPLLSVAGRTLVLIMEHPDMTMREISVRLGTVESNVQRAVAALSKAGLITRHRVGRNNHYQINLDTVMEHPDIWRLLAGIDSRIEATTNLETDL